MIRWRLARLARRWAVDGSRPWVSLTLRHPGGGPRWYVEVEGDYPLRAARMNVAIALTPRAALAEAEAADPELVRSYLRREVPA